MHLALALAGAGAGKSTSIAVVPEVFCIDPSVENAFRQASVIAE